MVDNRPLVATDADARSLYAYLQSLEPGDETAQAFTPVNMIEALPRGDADAGINCFWRPAPAVTAPSTRATAA